MLRPVLALFRNANFTRTILVPFLLLCLACALVFAPSAAQAAVKLFTAQWYAERGGNECKLATPNATTFMSPLGGAAPKCTTLTPDFTKYSVFAIPQGQLCNADQPRCPISSTPTSMGAWSPVGGLTPMDTTAVVPNCAPLSTYPAPGPNTRPAKGQTPMGTMTFRVPPVYRNPAFFTPSGQPKLTSCTARSTGVWTTTQTRFGADKGRVQRGYPITGYWNAVPTGTGHKAGFTIPPAPATGSMGIRTTALVGEFAFDYPYIYSYTYATIRNDKGVFGPGKGPGSFTYQYTLGTPLSIGGSIMLKQGKNKFGGTMKMLGALTTKVCYWLQAGGGGCSIQSQNWRYDAIGAPARYTMGGVVTMGAIYTWYQPYSECLYGSCLTVVGSRFPWTTGSVTVTAVARGPHKTVHYARGYDNRNTTTSLGKGTIQLVSPILTRWFGYTDYETVGIGILRIKFVPEPQTWVMLVAGASLLVVGYRLRGR
jgi:hypothetical protein